MNAHPGKFLFYHCIWEYIHLQVFKSLLSSLWNFKIKFMGNFLEFTWKRAFVRSVIVLMALFIGLSVPSFSVVLNLIGASATAIASFIVPPLLYLRLTSMKGDWPERYVSEFVVPSTWCARHIVLKNVNIVLARWFGIRKYLDWESEGKQPLSAPPHTHAHTNTAKLRFGVFWSW